MSSVLTYGKAALPLIPLASKLPFVAGGGGAMPDLRRQFTATTDPDRLAAYSKVCGLRLTGTMPATWPHILAFDAQMSVMTDGAFPFGAVGLVHIENEIEQLRPVPTTESLEIVVRTGEVRPHAKGKAFDLLTEAQVGGETVWRETSTMLRRGGGTDTPGDGPPAEQPEPSATWSLPGDLGRRYAAVSGDRNPIHLHALTAKPLGFPSAIAHGMWTKARCLAALEGRLPDAFTVAVRFRRPIRLPSKVRFGVTDDLTFAVHSTVPHLDGRIT